MSALIALFVCFIAVFALNPVAHKLQLLDKPCERKQHKGTVPLTGGMAIFVASVFAMLWAYPNDLLVQLYLISAAIIVLLGVIDDRFDLSVRIRLGVQVGVSALLIFAAGHSIHYFGNMFGFGALDVGIFGMAVTVLGVLGAINAFNMTDGIDGLAGSLALNSFASIALLFYLAGQPHYITWPLILACSILPYLLFNLGLIGSVRKIFMGDAGSMLIGLSIIWLLTLGTQTAEPAFRTVTALWVIALPLMDMATIIIRRVRKGRSAFAADRDHLHHVFLRAGFSSRSTLLILFMFSCVYSAIGILGEVFAVPEPVMFYGFIALFMVYMAGMCHARRVSEWLGKHLQQYQQG